MDKDTAIQMRDSVLDMACSLDTYINMIEREEAGEEVSDLEFKQCIGEFVLAYATIAGLDK
ncbi:MAG: hypothetical protein RR942_04685 [Romboutsia sp.]